MQPFLHIPLACGSNTHCCRRGMILASAIACIASVATTAQVPRVLINEVLYLADPASADLRRDHEWIELYNKDTVPISLANWILTDRDGAHSAAQRRLPAVSVPAGAYLLVHIAVGTNDFDFSDGCGEYYTGDPRGLNLLGDDTDDCALYSDPQGGSSAIVDYVAWNAGSAGYVAGVAHDDAVNAMQWPRDQFLNTVALAHSPWEKTRVVRPGTSIGRDRDSTETDRPADWDADGGRDALDITPCARNETPLTFDVIQVPPRPPKVWTIMVYMAADNNLERYGFLNLEAMERALAQVPDPPVHVVILVDGLRGLLQVSRPETRGGAWRFELGPDLAPNLVHMRTPAGTDPFLGSTNVSTPPDPNTADPATLSSFVTWAKQNYPAQKYGLILWDHGAGWKGVCIDDTSSISKRRTDALFMGELAGALNGADLELLGCDACLMAMIEVAWQVQPAARFFVASEEVECSQGWPYENILLHLMANPGWNGDSFGSQIVADYSAFYTGGEFDDLKHTLSCIDLGRVAPIVNAVSMLGADLISACTDFKTHGTPTDNVQLAIQRDIVHTQPFDDNNYIDLSDLTQRLRANGGIPDCYKGALKGLQAAFDRAVIANRTGMARRDAKGLSIYLPLSRSRRTDYSEEPGHVDPYDFPQLTRVSDASSQRAMYAPNPDCVPLQAVDLETSAPLAAPAVWPLVPTPAFRFPVDTLWDEFLICYYKPAADAHILGARTPTGQWIEPSIDDPECGNPVDRISVPPGSEVFFDASGSSDPDTYPAHWLWDFNDQESACQMCVQPWRVLPGSSPATANDDADVDCNGTPTDDEIEVDSVAPSRVFQRVGTYVVNLSVWDDDYTYPGRTSQPPTPCLPSAARTHINASSHNCVVEVAECNLLLGARPVQFCVGNDCLLVDPFMMPAVTIRTMPTFPIPNDINLLHLHLYAQVYMNNPAAYPLDPIRMSNGLDVELGVGTTEYGSGSGIRLWARQPPTLGGTLDMTFAIN